MGLMDENQKKWNWISVYIMNSLKDQVQSITWKPELATDTEKILMNYLFQDKGFTIPEMLRFEDSWIRVYWHGELWEWKLNGAI